MYRFGAFEVDPRAHELRRTGVRIKVQEQLFVVLLKLLERPGQLVTRDELRLAIWPADTFVDFDTGLNTIIMRLREVLRDSAEVPLFIETVPKLGYRFIAPVERLDEQHLAPELPPKNRRISVAVNWSAAAAILLLASAVAFLLFQRSASRRGFGLEIVPLTGTRGVEDYPAFSPDGNQVAFFLLDEHGNGTSGIYTTFIGGEKALQLTNNTADCCPAWSPDGRSVAFARSSSAGFIIYAVPALGGTSRVLFSVTNNYKEHIGKAPHFSWSPDGQRLAVSTPMAPGTASPQARQAIALLSLPDSTTRSLTFPPPERTDWSPAFSPDGKFVAFLRSSGPGMVDDLYVVPATGGDPKRLTFDNRDIDGALSWTPDSREIIFSSTRSGPAALWRIAAPGGAPSRVEGVGPSAYSPAIALKSQRLAYRSELVHVNLWLVRLRDARHAAKAPQLLLALKGQTALKYFSPDSRKIAFESNQSGYSEIWTVNTDGSNPAQLTFLNGLSGTPRWSYDGRFVAFDYRPADHSEIYWIDVSGGPPHILPTLPGADNTTPSWSHDGKWIYFSSNRGNGSTQVWKTPYPPGGAAIQLTKNGGIGPVEATDGFVYYASALETDEIWKIAAGGGEETLAAKATGLSCFCNWALSPTGIYFMKGEWNGDLFFYEFTSRKTFLISHQKYAGTPAAAPDGKSIVFSETDQADQTIMVVNHFR